MGILSYLGVAVMMLAAAWFTYVVAVSVGIGLWGAIREAGIGKSALWILAIAAPGFIHATVLEETDRRLLYLAWVVAAGFALYRKGSSDANKEIERRAAETREYERIMRG